MDESELKNKSRNFGKDLDSQETEKINYFLTECELKDFDELVYLCSSINKKYTALLYREKDHSYLYLFVFRHNIDKEKENISYKIKTKMKFNKNEIDKTNLEDKQMMFIDDQGNKNAYNEYNITLINKDLILLQVVGKKIIIVNFDKKEYTVLFCNSSDKKSIQVVSTYDELIVVNKEKEKKKQYQIRTYIFCVSSGKLYFFMINDKVFSDYQFLLIPFPFVEDYSDCIDFEILKITNRKTNSENSNKIDNKYYFLFIVLLNGKFIRYVTEWVNCGLKDILLNFHENLEKKVIKKNIDYFDKGNNNCGLKVYRSEKCASFIILQIGFHIFTFKYYETDSPEEMMKRFGFGMSNNNNNGLNTAQTPNSNNAGVINSQNNNNNYTSPTKNDADINDSNSLKNSGKNNNTMISTLNDSLSLSKVSLFQKARHGSLTNINLEKLVKNIPHTSASTNNIRNTQVSTESIMTSTKQIPSLEHTESNITFNDMKETIKDSTIMTKNMSLDMRNNSIPEFKTKDKGVIYYSLENFYDLFSDKDNFGDEENIKTSKENINEENSKLNDSFLSQNKNIIYSFTYHSFISFIQTTNNVIVCHNLDKSKEKNSQIEKVLKYNNKLYLSNDKIEILDVLHYYELKYSFLLTNKNILKFRVNTDLIHLFNILNKHKNNNASQNEKKRDSLYYKLKAILNFSRTNKIPVGAKCKLCKKRDSKIICPKCNRAIYCCEEHKQDDYKNIHFFQCEMNLCIEQLEKNKKKCENLEEINTIIISFKNILNQIFIFIENKKDYINYTVFLKIMLNILVYINLENSINKALTPMRTKKFTDSHDVCEKIFLIELWFFYCNLNILYITYTIKSENYFLATHLLTVVKIIDLIEKKDTKLPTMFAYFALSNDLTEYKIDSNNREEIENNSKNFFFDLFEIYTNENKKGKYLYILEQFFIYYLHSFSSLLKIHLFLKEKTKAMKGTGAINIDKIVYYIPKLLEDKYNNTDTNESNQSPIKIPLILIYYYLSFIIVKIDKTSSAVDLLRYILDQIHRVNNLKDSKISSIMHYSSLEAKIYLNIGILMNYNGDFILGINHLENCYRLCFQKKLSIYLTMKVLEMLCLAYINHDKIDTAFILVKSAISLRKKFLAEQKKKFNPTILIYKLNLFRLKIYLLFIYQYTSYKYQKMNNFLSAKSIKTNDKTIKNPDDIPSTVVPSKFYKVSPSLISYVYEEDPTLKRPEFFKDIITKDEETYRFELDSNLDKFILFCYNGKLEMIIKALEFLYKLSEKEYEILNNDNGSTQKEEAREETYNLKEKSSSVSRDFSMSLSKPATAYKEKFNFLFKQDNETFLDEIEVKMGLYDQLTDMQQKELKTIQNNIFRRSILLRDPKGRIDKFNLNYHPKYTLEFFELFSKLNETVFLNQLEKFGVGEQYEEKIFEHKNDALIYSLRKYLNLEKIQNIIYIQKVKLLEKYKDKLILIQKPEYKETVTKNQVIANEYINKLKEKFSKDKFLKNMNLEGLYEKLVNELTNNELNYILDNPSKILNYIYINSKTVPDYFDKAEDLFNKDESKKSSDNTDKSTSGKKSKLATNEKNENEKNNEEEEEKEKENANKKEDDNKDILSPKTIYNTLIDLISEKKNGRSGGKKRTVNFRNIAISDVLDCAASRGKKSSTINESKKSKKTTNKNWYRSVSLNKVTMYKKDKDKDIENKKKIMKSPTNYMNLRKESKHKNIPNMAIQNANTTKNNNFNIMNKESKYIKKFSKRNTSLYNKRINSNYSKRNTNIGNNINENILGNINNNENNKNNDNDNNNNFGDNILAIRNNNTHQRKKYERKTLRKDIGKTFVFEETIQQKDDNRKRRQTVKTPNKTNNPINSLIIENKTSNNINETPDSKKNENNNKKNIRKSIIISKKMLNYENLNNKSKENQKEENTNIIIKSKSKVEISSKKTNTIDNEMGKVTTSKTMNIKNNNKIEDAKGRTFVERKKPSFREFKQKILHKNISNQSVVY